MEPVEFSSSLPAVARSEAAVTMGRYGSLAAGLEVGPRRSVTLSAGAAQREVWK
jgi:hypothetical protein